MCLQCGKGREYLCQNCLSKVDHAPSNYSSKLISVWRYEGVVRKAILRLKYSFVKDIAVELGTKYARELKDNPWLPKDAILVPIPLSTRRHKWRGFNQAAEVGKVVASELGWGFEPTLLRRQRNTTPQVGLSKIERLRNTSGIFAVNLPREALAKCGGYRIRTCVGISPSSFQDSRNWPLYEPTLGGGCGSRTHWPLAGLGLANQSRRPSESPSLMF